VADSSGAKDARVIAPSRCGSCIGCELDAETNHLTGARQCRLQGGTPDQHATKLRLGVPNSGRDRAGIALAIHSENGALLGLGGEMDVCDELYDANVRVPGRNGETPHPRARNSKPQKSISTRWGTSSPRQGSAPFGDAGQVRFSSGQNGFVARQRAAGRRATNRSEKLIPQQLPHLL
jgi:hypothetical protein